MGLPTSGNFCGRFKCGRILVCRDISGIAWAGKSKRKNVAKNPQTGRDRMLSRWEDELRKWEL